MALNTRYAGTNDVILKLGGTRSRLSIGATGTDAIHPDAVGSFIVEASDVVDMHLAALYGTAGFGTNAAGTKAVPPLIRHITAWMAGAFTLESLEMTVVPNKSEWSKEMWNRAMEMVKAIEEGQ